MTADPLNVSSIRLQSTSSNLDKLILPITVLDNFISNHQMATVGICTKSYVKILKELFSMYLNPSLSSKESLITNKYVYETFDCFVKHKKEITVHIDDWWGLDSDLMGFLFANLVNDSNYPNDDNDQNQIQKEFLQVFANIDSLVLYFRELSFSLLLFLSNIRGTNIKKVVISDGHGGLGGWLSTLSSSSLATIHSEYKRAGYKTHIGRHTKMFFIEKE